MVERSGLLHATWIVNGIEWSPFSWDAILLAIHNSLDRFDGCEEPFALQSRQVRKRHEQQTFPPLDLSLQGRNSPSPSKLVCAQTEFKFLLELSDLMSCLRTISFPYNASTWKNLR